MRVIFISALCREIKHPVLITPPFFYYSAKDEGLGACAQTRVRRRIFSLFPMMVGSQVMKPTTKNQFCFLALIRCLVKFVVLESHSQSL